MKQSAFFLIVLATFLGVFSALQLNHLMNRKASTTISAAVDWHEGKLLIPTMGSTNPAAPADFREAARKVVPSVVSVFQYNHVQTWFGDQEGQLRQTGQGSGVILSKNGIIVTNNHVVEIPDDPEHSIVEQVKVRLQDKRSFTAKVVGRDRRSDLAVLKIEAQDLQPIEVGDSNKLEIGQWVVAVGNPLGFDNTVSVGVVSSLGRSLGLENSVLIDGIQTDAAINPGNSGGALTDAAGQLVGINSAIASGNGGSVGIGFAIPVNTVRRVVDQILKFGYAKYGGLGIGYDSQSAEILHYPQGRDRVEQIVGSAPPDHGIILTSVTPDGAAARAGIQRFDVLLAVDGQKVDDTLTLSKVLMTKQAGDTVNVSYWSKGANRTARVKLDEIRGD
ncbi:MAG: trypsin-like peptidase domain-containing protein [Fimbriimonas sp.]|nr:trypsin-like peptidase domain-containing protein [Fimbriimonas sp.]